MTTDSEDKGRMFTKAERVARRKRLAAAQAAQAGPVAPLFPLAALPALEPLAQITSVPAHAPLPAHTPPAQLKTTSSFDSGTVPVGRPRDQRRRLLVLSAVISILIPTLLAAAYYGLVAADQYAVEVKFAVRSNSGSSSGGDVLGMFTGISGPGSTMTDSYIVIDYINSRELLDTLEGKIGLRKIYSRDEADYFSRFDATLPSEELVKYWRNRVQAYLDNTSQIVTVEVRAFTAEDARTVATAILEQSEQLINNLSTRARDDAVKSAQQDLKRMEDQLKLNRTALRAFRDTKEEFDPVKQVEARYSILTKLEQDLSTARTKLSSLKNFMGDTAPSVTVLKGEITALERQMEEERAKLGNKGHEAGQQSLGGLVANYEELVVDREFSEKAYVSALASLERARIEADRQQRYVAAFVRPTLPQEPLYPKRILSTLAVLAITTVLWALGVLIAYAVRDHAL